MLAKALIDSGPQVSVTPNGNAFELVGEENAFAIGRIAGMALLKGVIFPLYFPLPYYKLLIGKEIIADDLKDVDRELYDNLLKM